MLPAHGLISNDTDILLLSLFLDSVGITESMPKIRISLREIPGIHHCAESKVDNVHAFVNFVVHSSMINCYFNAL